MDMILVEPQHKVTGSLELNSGARDETWLARLRIDGKPKKRTLGKVWTKRGRPPEGHLTRDMAEKALSDLMSDLRHGRVSLDKEVKRTDTFGYAAHAWLRHVEVVKKRKESTVRGYEIIVRSLEDHFGADMLIDEMTVGMIEEYRDDLQDRGLSTSTIAKRMIAMSGLFKYAHRKLGLAINPMVDVEWAPIENTEFFNVFTVEEIMRLADAAYHEFDRALFLVAGFCGLRAGELRALRWRDVDFHARTISVLYNFPVIIKKLPEDPKDLAKYTPKSNKPRTVPLADQIIPALKAWRLKSRFSDDADLVFCGISGDLAAYDPIRRRYLEAQQKAGLERRRFHDLRHSAATIFARVFPSAFTVQEIMGHADLATTRKYVHMRPKGDEAALLSEALSQVLENEKPQPPKKRGFYDPAKKKRTG
jgi:integrase